MRTPSSDQTVTVKDMSDEFVAQIKQYQEQIDDFWQKNLLDKRSIVYVNERLQRVFKKISPKISEKDVKRQNFFQKRIHEVGQGMFYTKNVQDSQGLIAPKQMIEQKKYNKFKFLVEKRELELNGYLEAMGLTAKTQGRRLR